MNKRNLLAVLLMAILFAGCYKDDIDELQDNVNNIANRVKTLEQWMNETNTNIASLQTIVTALEKNDYITSVTALADSAGYEINFSQSGKITIYNGKNGASGSTPEIAIKKDTDGNYCWTLDGEFMTDADGKNISAMGLMPQLKIEADYWHISYDGKTWTKLGKAKGDDGADGEDGANGWGGTGAPGKDGDSIFAKDGVDVSDPSVITFTLKDGVTTFTVPRVLAVNIVIKNTKVPEEYGKVKVDVQFENLEKDNFKALIVEVLDKDGNSKKIYTTVTKTISELEVDGVDFTTTSIPTTTVTFNPEDNTEVILEITVIDANGNNISKSELIVIENVYKVYNVSEWNEINNFLKEYPNGTIKLMNDIDFNGSEFTQIETLNGIFDGQGYTISNCNIYPTNQQPAVIHKVGKNGIVKNLNCSEITTYSINLGASGIARKNEGTIMGCKIENSTIDAGYGTIGSISFSNEGTIIACYADNIDFKKSTCAGIAYFQYGSIVACYSKNCTYNKVALDGISNLVGSNTGTLTASYYLTSENVFTNEQQQTGDTWEQAVINMNAAIDDYNKNASKGKECLFIWSGDTQDNADIELTE